MITQEQQTAYESVESALTRLFSVLKPTSSEIDEANNFAVDDLERSGATDYEIARYTFQKRQGEK